MYCRCALKVLWCYAALAWQMAAQGDISKVDQSLSKKSRRKRMSACIRATRRRLESRSEEVETAVSSLMAQSTPGMKEFTEEEAVNQLFSLTVFACYEHVDNQTIVEVLQGAEQLDEEKGSTVFRDVLSARRPSRAQMELYEAVVQEEQARLLEQMTPDDMPGALGNIGRKMSTATKAAYVVSVLAGCYVPCPQHGGAVGILGEPAMAYRQTSTDSHGGRSTPGGEVHEVDTNGAFNFKNRAISKTNAPSKGTGLAGLSLRKNMGAAPVKIETPRTGRRVSGAGADFFDGENIDDIVKSLISTKKIDSAWQRISRRVATLESYIQHLRGGEGDDAFLTRKEFIEFLQSQESNDDGQEDGGEEIPGSMPVKWLFARCESREHLSPWGLRQADAEEPEEPPEDPLLLQIRAELKAQEDANTNALRQAMEGARQADEAKWVRFGELEDKYRQLEATLEEERSDRSFAEAAFKDQLQQLSSVLEDLEPRMQAFATSEARRHISQLLFRDGDTEAQWISETTRVVEEPSGSACEVDVPEGPPEGPLHAETNTLEVPASPPERSLSSASAVSRSLEVSEAERLARQHAKVLHAAEGTSDGLCHNAYEWRVALLGLVHTGLVEPLREEAQRTSSNFMLSHDVDAFLSWKYYPLRGLEKEMLDVMPRRRGDGALTLDPDQDEYEMKALLLDLFFSLLIDLGRAAVIRHYLRVKDELELELIALGVKAAEMNELHSSFSTASTCDTTTVGDAVRLNAQRDDFQKKIREKEKEIIEAKLKGQKVAKDLREEADMRKGEAIENITSFQKVYKLILEAGQKAAGDNDKAMDKIRGVQGQVDHLHVRLEEHGKDIADRATLADAKTLTDTMKLLVQKEAYNNQIVELKKILDNQSDRIGSIDLQVSVMAKNGSASPSSSRRAASRARSAKLRMKREVAKSSTSFGASTGLGQDSIRSLAGTSQPQDDDEGRLAALEDQEGYSDDEEPQMNRSRSQASKVSLPANATTYHDFDDEDNYTTSFLYSCYYTASLGMEDFDDEEEFSDYSDDPMEEQLREQVQGICMGLVCLAHHVLRGPPLVGLSRQSRLLNEKDLLEELMSLRYWVTHRKTPSDWSLDRLRTVALRYSHPNPMEVHGPQPDMSYILRHAASPRDPTSTKSSLDKALSDGRLSSPRGARHPLDTSVGSIGIDGGFGSSAGGGAGIFGGPLEDATLLPSAATMLPTLEGSQLTSGLDKVAGGSGRGWRASKLPLSAREARAGMAATLPPL
eukprot:s17_g31.t2